MALSITNLTVTYPTGRRAVQGATFAVAPGEVVALLGGNGAGKSTTMKVLAGVVPSTSGTVQVAGYDMSVEHEADAARARTGYCPDLGGLTRQLTVREHIGLALACAGDLTHWPAAYALAERLDLTRVLDEPVGSFSHGMARRTSALLALLGAKDVLLLDEPFDGVDAEGVGVLSEAIRTAAKAGLAVVISTHLTDVATSIASTCVVMRDGQVVATVAADELAGADGARQYLHLISAHDETGDTAVVPAEDVTAPHERPSEHVTSWTPGELPEGFASPDPAEVETRTHRRWFRSARNRVNGFVPSQRSHPGAGGFRSSLQADR